MLYIVSTEYKERNRNFQPRQNFINTRTEWVEQTLLKGSYEAGIDRGGDLLVHHRPLP